MSSKVDAFFEGAGTWRDEMERLRWLALDCGLGETLKWGKPCFTLGESNVAILQPFKKRCALMFFKGALLKDPGRLLERPGASSHIARRMMFSSVADVKAMEKRLRELIAEAIAIEEAGLKVERPTDPEPPPPELEELCTEVPDLRRAFEGLTPGRRRAYILHFSAAKQARTRRSRVEKCVPRILAGKGLRD